MASSARAMTALSRVGQMAPSSRIATRALSTASKTSARPSIAMKLNNSGRIAFRRAYADEAPKPKPKPGKIRRTLRWTWRLTYLSLGALVGYTCYVIYDDRHPQEQYQPDPSKKTLVVLGSGWGSVGLLKNLDTENYNVIVVSPRNYFLFTPLLPSCTTGLIEHRSIMEPVLFRQMTEKGCAPNFITYNVLINHCCTAGLLDKAHKILEEMKQTCWPRHISGHRNIIQGFSKKFISSLGLLDEITHYNLIPIAPAYIILINSFSSAGQLEIALELHREIEGYLSCSSVANSNMYFSIIQGLCLASKVEKAIELYSQMLRKGYVPELIIFFCLIKGLLRVNKWDEALQLLYTTYNMGIEWHNEETSEGN